MSFGYGVLGFGAHKRGRVLVYDTFSDDDLTDLASHTPDIDTEGGGWSKVTGSGLRILSNALHVTGTGNSIYIIDAGNADTHIQIAFQSDGVSSEPVDIIFRYQDTSNYWRLYINATSYRLLEVTGGSAYTRDTVSKTISNDVEYIINLKAVGDSITYWVDGDTPSEYTSSVRSTIAIIGIKSFGAPAATTFIDDFTVAAV